MKSIRVKMILPFLVGMLALTAILSLYTYYSAHTSMKDAVLVVSQAKSDQTAMSMALLFRSMLSTIQNITADPHLALTASGKTEEDISWRYTDNEWMELLAHGNDYYRNIFLTDSKGVCVSSSNPGFIGKPYAEWPQVQQALTGQFAIGSFDVGRITKKLSAVIAGPVNTGADVVGTLVIICDFPKIVDYDVESDAITTSLLCPSGKFKANADRSLMGNENETFPELYSELQSVGRNGDKVRYELKGHKYTGFAKLEPTTRWMVISSGRDSDLFASARATGATVLGISLLVLLFVSLVVARFASGIMSDLMSLIGYAKDISDGRFASHLDTTTRDDELGILHNSLEKLVDTLQRMIFKTQEVSRMKGEFLANMSHEIRTPINAIMGMAHLALRDTEISKKQHDYLDKIQIAARSLLGVINDILDISKIEAGKLALESVPFDLKRLVHETAAIHQVNADNKSLYLTVEYPDDIPEFFVGDPLRIGQILNNIISNAIKFTERGGISIGCELRETAESYAYLGIDISDTGIGISKKQLKKLFEPFTQAEASTTRQFGGTGLGLTISKSLLELMKGALDVKSEVGAGSTFSISMALPLADGPPAAAEQGPPTADDFKNLNLTGKTILIAEDNLINQTILEELIAPSKATIVLTANGREAVDAVFGDEKIDLVLMDMQMPIMDGLQATRKIRSVPEMAGLPIIAVSANAMKEDREQGMAADMNGYITKPIEIRELYETLKTWLT